MQPESTGKPSAGVNLRLALESTKPLQTGTSPGTVRLLAGQGGPSAG